MEKNKLGQEISKNTNDLKLCKLYNQLKNKVTSTIRNTEITFYSNELEAHKFDISKSWKIKKTFYRSQIISGSCIYCQSIIICKASYK